MEAVIYLEEGLLDPGVRVFTNWEGGDKKKRRSPLSSRIQSSNPGVRARQNWNAKLTFSFYDSDLVEIVTGLSWNSIVELSLRTLKSNI